jgi:hypothetical protein
MRVGEATKLASSCDCEAAPGKKDDEAQVNLDTCTSSPFPRGDAEGKHSNRHFFVHSCGTAARGDSEDLSRLGNWDEPLPSMATWRSRATPS